MSKRTETTDIRDSLPVSLNELQAPCDNLALTRKLDDIYPPINSFYRQKFAKTLKMHVQRWRDRWRAKYSCEIRAVFGAKRKH